MRSYAYVKHMALAIRPIFWGSISLPGPYFAQVSVNVQAYPTL